MFHFPPLARQACEREKFDGRLYDTTQKTRIDDFSSMRGLCYAVKAFHIPALACYRCFPNCQRTKIAVKHGEFSKRCRRALARPAPLNIGTSSADCQQLLKIILEI